MRKIYKKWGIILENCESIFVFFYDYFLVEYNWRDISNEYLYCYLEIRELICEERLRMFIVFFYIGIR